MLVVQMRNSRRGETYFLPPAAGPRLAALPAAPCVAPWPLLLLVTPPGSLISPFELLGKQPDISAVLCAAQVHPQHQTPRQHFSLNHLSTFSGSEKHKCFLCSKTLMQTTMKPTRYLSFYLQNHLHAVAASSRALSISTFPSSTN